MYSKQEASILRQQFWTSLGQYLSPIPSASGNKINWINYKTGNRYIHFKMDVSDHAYIAIEILHEHKESQEAYFNHFKTFKLALEKILSEKWIWENVAYINGKQVSRIYQTLDHVNIFNQTDWPQIISFFKPRIILLDKFWIEHKDIFDMLD